ncbi:MAG TPA: Rho termination factor N-terminal domain-containing protein, partial [Pseudonocardia sp.]|nr:Rho termination factor N-terminal domain-containing protein [Pseudonocardia sp.]
MSETDLVSTDTPTPRKRGGLTGMVLAELRQLAGELKIPDTAGMRKGDLIAAIRAAQGGSSTRKAATTTNQLSLSDEGPAAVAVEASPPAETTVDTP